MEKNKKNLYIFWGIIAGIIVLGVLVDMLTKHFFTDQFFSLISGFLSVHFTLNFGGAWSILSGHTWLLVVLSLVIIIAFFVFCLMYKYKTPLFAVGAGLIFAGAVGNLIDRIIFGAVRDFIKLDFMEFPIFNIADCLLTVGAVVLIVYFLFFASKQEDKIKLEQK